MRVGDGKAVGHGVWRVVGMFIPLVVGLLGCSTAFNDLPFYFVFMCSSCFTAFNDFSLSSSVIRPPQFIFYKPACMYICRYLCNTFILYSLMSSAKVLIFPTFP